MKSSSWLLTWPVWLVRAFATAFLSLSHAGHPHPQCREAADLRRRGVPRAAEHPSERRSASGTGANMRRMPLPLSHLGDAEASKDPSGAVVHT